jgi:hypothetical protein
MTKSEEYKEIYDIYYDKGAKKIFEPVLLGKFRIIEVARDDFGRRFCWAQEEFEMDCRIVESYDDRLKARRYEVFYGNVVPPMNSNL